MYLIHGSHLFILGPIRKLRDKVGYHLARLARKVSEKGYQIQDAHFTGYQSNGDFRETGEDYFITQYARFIARSSKSNPFVFVDVGANSGYYTQLVIDKLQAVGAQRNLRGELFEPQDNAPLQNLINQYTQHPQILLNWQKEGAGAESGTLEFYKVKGDDSSLFASSQKESVLHFVDENQVEKSEIKVVRLDEYLSSKAIPVVDLLKVDTEGYELEVLRGAGSFLTPASIRVIQFEFNSMHAFRRQFLRDFIDVLGAKGYELFRISKHRLIPVTPYNPETERFVYQNLVAFDPSLVSLHRIDLG